MRYRHLQHDSNFDRVADDVVAIIVHHFDEL